MKNKLVVLTALILALLLCSCVHIERTPQPADTPAATEVFVPIDTVRPFVTSETEPPTQSVTETSSAPVTKPEPEPKPKTDPVPIPEHVIAEGRFPLADIAENGRTLDLYGIESTPALAALEKALNEYDGSISFVAYDVTGEAALAYNTSQTYCSHCTVKAGYMLYCYKKLEVGAVNPDAKLTYLKRHHTVGAGIVQNNPFGKKYTVEKLLELCLSISDNTAYKMLIEHFGKPSYNDYMKSLGADSLVLPENTMWANHTKPADLVKVWLEIYRFFDRGSYMARMMKKNCTGTPYCYITAALPELKYSHKSGEYYDDPAGFHDAAIIWNERPYIVCAMSDSNGTKHEKPFAMIITTVNDIFTGLETGHATSAE